MILCLTGNVGAGKSLVMDILKDKGFATVEMSDIVRGLMKERNIEITNKNLENFAVSMREEHGRAVFAEEVVKAIKTNPSNLVISGVRGVEELDVFRKNFHNFYIINVFAPTDLRYERLLKRGRPTDPKRKEDFEFREEKNRGYGLEETEALADYVIFNTSSLEELRYSVSQMLENIEKAQG